MLRRIIVSMLFVAFFSITLSALEVDVDEISGSKKIDFINYEGKGGKFESIDEIMSIGYGLAYRASKGGYGERFRYHMKYSVLRIEPAGEKGRFAADIFYIDKDARVDHIKNIRRIISAYLENLYGYSPEQARALALFVTYYNAVHRGDVDYFKTKYQENVTSHLTPANAGIAVRYDQWPGKTALVIPLTVESKRGKIGGIDPFEISDEKVKKEVGKDSENTGDRKELVNIKEDEIKKLKDGLEKDKAQTENKKKETEKKRNEVDKKKEEVRKDREKIEKEKEDTKKIKDPGERKKKEDEIKKKEEELKNRETTSKKDDEKVKKEEETVKKQETENKKQEEDIKKKEEDTKKEKEELTGDNGKKDTGTPRDTTPKDTTPKDTTTKDETVKKEKELEKKEKELDKREDRLRDKQLDPNVYGLKIYYMEIKDYLDGGHYNNILYMINATTKKIDFKSPVTNICGRRYDIYSGGIVVITHQGSHVSGHRLTLIDREKLTAIKTGTDNIFWRSFIEINNGFIFAIVKEDDSYYLGKFDSTLKLVAKSKDRIHQNSFITFYEDSIFINREDMTIIVLKQADLSLVDEIKP